MIQYKCEEVRIEVILIEPHAILIDTRSILSTQCKSENVFICVPVSQISWRCHTPLSRYTLTYNSLKLLSKRPSEYRRILIKCPTPLLQPVIQVLICDQVSDLLAHLSHCAPLYRTYCIIRVSGGGYSWWILAEIWAVVESEAIYVSRGIACLVEISFGWICANVYGR